ncbi:hypothetical protein CYLTODRAFT_3294 [Cylindrobasidium torrendii FP15055 ss-10]|uniref:Uncharacterized protein n=1 Tax=Cylindrobasidium torrendii FP15055 ss-10 TaxID=1314674 RepID=A0A0D7BXJ1_9AGAR|nr:hypothetical protein CYLTODRAFT_3294 [Cylindrobasidium torrendii FP15055 ss-10]
MARSPPARPHIGVHSTHFSAFDWGDDDAWDSGSDDETAPRKSAPRPVPKASTSSSVAHNSDASSSNLSFSYTHVSAPNPSSYPPREEPPVPKSGWTIVRTGPEDEKEANGPEDSFDDIAAETRRDDADVDGDMILGELEYDTTSVDPDASTLKGRSEKSGIRNDVEAVVTGVYPECNTFLC